MSVRAITEVVSNGSSFRFRLERVRELRERHTDAARQELARALCSLDDSRERLGDAEAELTRAQDAQRSARAAAPALDAARLCAQQAYAEHVEDKRQARLQELAHSRASVAARSDELARAARSQQTLERLKRRRRAEHEQDAAQRESATLDEIALQRFQRSAA